MPSRTYYPQKGEGGYTLVELLVAMLITMILGATMFALYLAVYRWVGPWQREIALEDTIHLLGQRLLADVAEAEQLILHDSTYTLTYPTRPPTHYRQRDRVLLRNERPMHDSSLVLAAFALTPSRLQTQFAPNRREQPDPQASLLVELHLALASKERRFDLVASTVLRRKRPWHPLSPLPAAEDSPDSTSAQAFPGLP